MKIPHELLEIFDAIEALGGRPLIVGGGVRDWALGIDELKDFDIEVFGLSLLQLTEVLSKFGRVDTVGKSFGITKLFHPTLIDLDFSLPRRDSKTGAGHTGFTAEFDPQISVAEACLRRDFTINSMAWCRYRGLIDIFGGVEDLKNLTLRHTSDAYDEDPLRVLRGFQFCGRFGLAADPTTIKISRGLRAEYSTLSKERVWGEWEKWAAKSTRPSYGLTFLKETGWLSFYSELLPLESTEQDPEWHPETNVWIHTALVCDEAARIAAREGLDREQKVTLVFAALCHDLGKPATTEFIDGRVRSRGHEEAGIEPTRLFLRSIGAPGWLEDRVVPLVKHHLAHCGMGDAPSDRAVRRLSVALGKSSIQELAWLVEADHSGRPPLPKGMPVAMQVILDKAEKLAVNNEQPTSLVMGRHLIALGVAPGPEMGKLLKASFEAQLDGRFNDVETGVSWVKDNLL